MLFMFNKPARSKARLTKAEWEQGDLQTYKHDRWVEYSQEKSSAFFYLSYQVMKTHRR